MLCLLQKCVQYLLSDATSQPADITDTEFQTGI